MIQLLVFFGALSGLLAGTLYLLAARTAGSITTPASPLSGPGPPETAPTG